MKQKEVTVMEVEHGLYLPKWSRKNSMEGDVWFQIWMICCNLHADLVERVDIAGAKVLGQCEIIFASPGQNLKLSTPKSTLCCYYLLIILFGLVDGLTINVFMIKPIEHTLLPILITQVEPEMAHVGMWNEVWEEAISFLLLLIFPVRLCPFSPH